MSKSWLTRAAGSAGATAAWYAQKDLGVRAAEYAYEYARKAARYGLARLALGPWSPKAAAK